jgi:hypothetical protein
LLYSLEVGKDEKWLVQQAQRTGMPLPPQVKEAPELWPGLELYLMAFMELTSCRGLGYGAVGPIPWLAIHHYCEAHDVSGEQREDLLYYVQHMDKAYLDWQTKKGKEDAARREAEGKKKAPAPRGKKR